MSPRGELIDFYECFLGQPMFTRAREYKHNIGVYEEDRVT